MKIDLIEELEAEVFETKLQKQAWLDYKLEELALAGE